MPSDNQAFGRRIQNLLGTSFLYDGANAAQELSGTTATANMLTGGIDEFFNRTDSSGSVTPLQDALGSTIALVDGSGVVATSYTYDPFGNTTLSGAVSGNPSQYTGRENEGNGLYFYRARYYSPLLGRFVSEDPLRLASGDVNFYAYVGDSPTNFTDPTGLSRECPVPSLCGDRPRGAQSLAGRKDRWGSSGPHLHGCDIATGAPLPGSEALCDDNGNFAGEAPGAISADTMNGAIIFGGGGLLTGAAGGAAGATVAADPVEAAADSIEEWLGPGYTRVDPGSGGSDLILRSADGTRQIRFDLTNPHGLSPHVNVEEWVPRNSYPGDTRWIQVTNRHIFPGGKP